MHSHRHHLATVLGIVLHECERSAELLEKAANAISNSVLQPMLRAYSLRRQAECGRVGALLIDLGATPSVGHSSFARSFYPGQNRAILASCRQSETRVLERLHRLCARPLPDDVRHEIETVEAEADAVARKLIEWGAPETKHAA